jgi:spermidine synthase
VPGLFDFTVDVPEGTSGDWAVERFTVTEEDERRQRMRIFSSMGRFVPAGTYTRLTRNGHVVMSDTPDEIRDHAEAIYQASGSCLIHGLGLGVVIEAIKDKADHITVVEISEDVIKLVGPHYEAKLGDRLTIIHGDALTWAPPHGVRYNMVWHDIWDNICSDNLPEMKRLHRRYGRRTDWQGSWARHLCE